MSVAQIEAQEILHEAPSGLWKDAFARLRRNPGAVAGMIIVATMVSIALFAPLLATEGPNEVHLERLQGVCCPGPSADNVFGVDELGRDVFSRLMYGARYSLLIGIVSVIVGLSFGVLLGSLAGYLGGWVDTGVMRCMDVMLAIPQFLLAIGIVALLGPGLFQIMIAIGIANVPIFARLLRGSILAQRETDFVLAARSVGVPRRSILATHILPNAMSPVIVQGTLALATAIIDVAGLGFLGLGPPDPGTPEWGAMLTNTVRYLQTAPHLALIPGAAIVISVLGFNLIGDGLREALDPRLRGRVSPLLEVEDLHVAFGTERGTVHAVNGVTFAVEPGETLGIVGESGCGKSVTSLAILGLLARSGRVTRGSARFDGQDLIGLSDRSLRRIRGKDVAMIFQDPMTSLNPVLTVGAQLREPLQEHFDMDRKVANVRAAELLAQVGIPHPKARLKDYPHQFSGGMRQRAMIAMALACEPRLLIADEPTTALDVTIQAQILRLLQTLVQDMGTALITITHDLGVVAGTCERVAVMYGGMFVETGSVDQIFERPRHPYTVGLLRSVPRLDAVRGTKLEPIPGSPRNMLSAPSACPFQPRCPNAIAPCVESVPPLEEVEPGHAIRCFNPVPVGVPLQPTLETVP